MQGTLLDILILALLVLLFGSIYRKRPSPRLRYWMVGWACVVTHFVILLPNPSSPALIALKTSSGLVMLLLAAAAFLLAADRAELGPRGTLKKIFLLTGPASILVFLTQFDITNFWLLLPLIAFTQGCILIAVWQVWRRRRLLLLVAYLFSAVAFYTSFLAVRNPDYAILGIYPVLTELYLLNAVLYAQDFGRRTMGVITGVAGLVTWSVVFPLAIGVALYFPHHTLSPEWWNIPKFFVEFGMILTLLEDEIQHAGKQREDYRILFDGNPHPMWITERITLDFLRVNEAAVLQYGYSQGEFMRMNLRDLHAPEEKAAFERQFLDTVPEPRVSGPWTHIRKDGTRLQAEISSHGILFENHLGRFSLVQDVTERVEMHDRLLHQANHDALTGLPNRLLLKDRMAQTLATAARRGNKVAVICLDLDRFKQINDTYGHGVGDLSLKTLADRLSSRLRATDTVARSGGEEFTVLLGGLTSAADAERVVSGLLHEIRLPFTAEGYTLELSASIGIAMFPDDGIDSQDLWRASDVAMYRAKNSGGNQYLFVSHEISQSANEANEIESYIRRCLKDGGFRLCYQAQYTDSGTLTGLEALLRLSHPLLGVIPPDRFIPIAEESGLIMPLGRWVLEEVCRQISKWEQQGIAPVRVGVNVSPLQFMRTDFSAQVKEVLSTFGTDPRFLDIELTETSMMRNLKEIARQMHDLSNLGVRFSVDDFGTGYSSLRNLHELPIQTLKIDHSFIDRIAEPDGSYAIVQAIISMSHSLGLEVVAEGVEREEQAAILRELGCDVLQGFLYALPQTAEETAVLLQENLRESTNLPSQL
ncbi:putative bifunctional diguanylate cyclase/phosphodiesterase [Silvibacterium acidisoli]|uniref:putative bifunctional diguanylate cyclase/phosphodiesterase n=1 Tax=Acidobacteriaceae bacterium ZG23-2 TaxID=2883246 RepID=UPI00406C45D7